MSTLIKLRSIRDDETSAGYEFDPATERYRRVVLPAEDHDVRGFADVRQIGVRHKEQVFASIYSHAGLLHVAIPPQHFSWPSSYVARRRSLLSRVKSFSIGTEARRLLHFRYIFIDSQHGFPGPEASDIFYMIAWKTSSPEIIRGCIYSWESMANGENLASSDFQRRLKAIMTP